MIRYVIYRSVQKVLTNPSALEAIKEAEGTWSEAIRREAFALKKHFPEHKIYICEEIE